MTGFDGRDDGDDGGLREEMLRGGELLELVQEALLLQLLPQLGLLLLMDLLQLLLFELESLLLLQTLFRRVADLVLLLEVPLELGVLVFLLLLELGLLVQELGLRLLERLDSGIGIHHGLLLGEARGRRRVGGPGLLRLRWGAGGLAREVAGG